MFGLTNTKNDRDSNKSNKLYKISNVKVCFKLYPVTRWHMSSHDISSPASGAQNRTREWHANAMLNNKPRIKGYFRVGWDRHI